MTTATTVTGFCFMGPLSLAFQVRLVTECSLQKIFEENMSTVTAESYLVSIKALNGSPLARIHLS